MHDVELPPETRRLARLFVFGKSVTAGKDPELIQPDSVNHAQGPGSGEKRIEK